MGNVTDCDGQTYWRKNNVHKKAIFSDLQDIFVCNVIEVRSVCVTL